jgi:tetrahydromethanopterin S-methyltransferase subunit F
MKELIRKFLKDKVAIQSYVEDLKHDVEMIADDFDTTSYKKGIAELTALSLAL